MVATRSFWASDHLAQKRERVEAPAKGRVGDITGGLLKQLRLPERDPQGNGLSYRLHNDTQGTQLTEADILESVVAEDDLIIPYGEPVAG